MPNIGSQDRYEPLEPEFEEVFERYYPRVSRFFVKRGFSADRSQDLAQKTFLQAYRGWDRHRRYQRTERVERSWDQVRKDLSGDSGDERDSGWIFTIALNIYRNEIRRSKTQKRDAHEESLGSLHESGWEPVSDQSPEAELLTRQRVDLLEKAMAELAPGMRRCFELRFAHGLKYREIADVLRISIQSVKSQLHQARKHLENLLSE